MNKWNMLVVNEKLSQSVCLAPTPEKKEEYELYKKYFNELYEEIERLNNIINELEKDIDLELYKTRANDEYNKGLFNAFRYVKDKLQELKRRW